MRTGLENPTRYHVIQKQRSQVRQYLSESFQHPLSGALGDVACVQMHSAPNLHTASPVSPSLSSVATSTDEVSNNPSVSQYSLLCC